MTTLIITLRLLAIILPGVSHTLALLVEFKDPNTKQTTKWGRRALIFVVSTTMISSLALLTEQYVARQSLDEAAKSAREATELLKKAAGQSEEAAAQSKVAA